MSDDTNNRKDERRSGGQNQGAGECEEKCSIKNMTKAERRELQDRQRREKAEKISRGELRGSKQPVVNQQPSEIPKPNPSVRLYDPKKELKKDKHRTVVRQAAEKPVGFFSHLPQNEKFINIQSHLKKQDDIHPTILTLGVKYSEFFITGANARCIALLSALERVITDYQAPEGASLSRTLASMISKQVDFLSNVRVLGTSMKTVIRQLKSEISVLPPDISDEDAKTRVCKFIQEFARNRIILAGDFIVQEAINQRKIVNGDVILVYAKSSLVEKFLLHAHNERKLRFRVIIVDSHPKYEGRPLLKSLDRAGISCQYALINSLSVVIPKATKVVVGASAVYANGSILSRVGTALVCAIAYKTIPVIVLCESCKFSEEVRLDSITWNEIGDPEELVTRSTGLASHIIARPPRNQPARDPPVLSGWRDIERLKLLNIHYDVTPAKCISVLICEYGLVKSTCAAGVLRFAQDKCNA